MGSALRPRARLAAAELEEARLAFGTAVWGASLVELPAMGLAPPVWEMPSTSIALDLSYHLVYGAGVAAGYAAVNR